MYTWRQSIGDELGRNCENWGDVIAHTLTDEQLDLPWGYIDEDEIADDYIMPPTFVLWTHTRVYFSVTDDLTYWCTSVPRHPNGETPRPFRGG